MNPLVLCLLAPAAATIALFFINENEKKAIRVIATPLTESRPPRPASYPAVSLLQPVKPLMLRDPVGIASSLKDSLGRADGSGVMSSPSAMSIITRRHS